LTEKMLTLTESDQCCLSKVTTLASLRVALADHLRCLNVCGAGGDDDGDDGEFVLAVRASDGDVGGGNGVVERLGQRHAVGDGVGDVVDDVVGNVVTDAAVSGIPVGTAAGSLT
jgi:hypothetical protein